MTKSSDHGTYDLAIVGGGTAALIAAHGAAGVGARVVLIEQERMGGDCLWTGCVPSKALIAAAATAHAFRTADVHGIASVEPKIDLAKVMARIRAAQAVIEPHDSSDRLRSVGVDVIIGRACFAGPARIRVNDVTIKFRKALIATGSRPSLPPIPGLVEAHALTSDTIWGLTELPRRLVVLGGGPIGCELGQAFSRLGSSVTIVEAMDHLLPRELPDVGAHLAQRFIAEGMTIRTATRAEKVDRDPTDPHPTNMALYVSQEGVPDRHAIPFDQLLVSTGRRPSTADLGLDQVGVEVDPSGAIVVDELLRTTNADIYAAGDVTATMPFTHVAAYQARLVVTNALFGLRRKASTDMIPWVTFTDPEIARVGIDAVEAREQWGDKALVQRFDYAGLDRAIAHGDPNGFAELVGDAQGKLVGATVVGTTAGESIAELTALMTTGAKVADLSNIVHAYPTFSEGPSRAADDVLRAKYFSPAMGRLTRTVLKLRRGWYRITRHER